MSAKRFKPVSQLGSRMFPCSVIFVHNNPGVSSSLQVCVFIGSWVAPNYSIQISPNVTDLSKLGTPAIKLYLTNCKK